MSGLNSALQFIYTGGASVRTAVAAALLTCCFWYTPCVDIVWLTSQTFEEPPGLPCIVLGQAHVTVHVVL